MKILEAQQNTSFHEAFMRNSLSRVVSNDFWDVCKVPSVAAMVCLSQEAFQRFTSRTDARMVKEATSLRQHANQNVTGRPMYRLQWNVNLQRSATLLQKCGALAAPLIFASLDARK